MHLILSKEEYKKFKNNIILPTKASFVVLNEKLEPAMAGRIDNNEFVIETVYRYNLSEAGNVPTDL